MKAVIIDKSEVLAKHQTIIVRTSPGGEAVVVFGALPGSTMERAVSDALKAHTGDMVGAGLFTLERIGTVKSSAKGGSDE